MAKRTSTKSDKDDTTPVSPQALAAAVIADREALVSALVGQPSLRRPERAASVADSILAGLAATGRYS